MNTSAFVFLLILGLAAADCGTFAHYCMNYNTHWGKYSAVAETNLKGFVKSLVLTEYRYSGIACTGPAFLVITTSYSLTANKGQKDETAATYGMKIDSIMLHTENATALVENGFNSTPAITTSPFSLANLVLTRNGQPHLTVEKESIGSSSEVTLTFDGIIFKGIPMSPYNRVGDEGCFDYGSLIGWIVGVSVAILVIILVIFILLVQVHRRTRANSLYASYGGTGNIKQLQSSLA